GGGGDDTGGGSDDTGGGSDDTGGGGDDTGGGTDMGGGGDDTGGGGDDAIAEDTGGGEECVPETCPTPPATEPDVALISKTGLATGFEGGDVPMGNWALEAAELYPDSLNNGAAFPIPLEASSNGNTFGSVQFIDGAWGLLANIDVKLAIPSLGQNFEFTQEVSGGGCCTFEGSTIVGDLLACYEGDPPEISLPESFMYNNAEGTLRILVEINKDVILNAIPAEFAGLAGMFIKSDLQIVLEFSAIIQ
ncbi:MAG: hypothetical protein HUU55_21050, partial [Myxococcales bacterium]|nr:hypothetical protein [Myxococcales bacterium]